MSGFGLVTRPQVPRGILVLCQCKRRVIWEGVASLVSWLTGVEENIGNGYT